MASSDIQVTVGSGTRLRTATKTEDSQTRHSQYHLIDDADRPSYIASHASSGAASSLATANAHIYQVMAGASLRVRVRRIEIYQAAAATTAAIGQFRLHRLTTAGTGGTTESVNALDPADSAASCTAMRLPTVKGTEGTLIVEADVYLFQTVGASTPFPQPVIVWDFDRLRSKSLIIAAGTSNGIAIKYTTGTAGAAAVVNVWLEETSF